MKLFSLLLPILLSINLYSQVEYSFGFTTGYSHSVFPMVIDGAVDFSQTPAVFQSRKNRFHGASFGLQFAAYLPQLNAEFGIESYYTRSFHPSFDQIAVNSSSRISYDMQQLSLGPTVGCYVGKSKRLKVSAGLPLTILAHYKRESQGFAGADFSTSRLYKGRVSVGISTGIDYQIFSAKKRKLFVGILFFGNSSYAKSLTIKRSSDPEAVFIEYEPIGKPLSNSEPNTSLSIQLHRLQFNLRYMFLAM